MLRDNALKFYMDQAYDISQKPIENGQYMNNNGLLAAILKIREILEILIFKPSGFTNYKITTF